MSYLKTPFSSNKKETVLILVCLQFSGVDQLINQEEIHNQCLSDNPKIKEKALEQLKHSFSLLKNKQQAWNDLHRLVNDENYFVRSSVAFTLVSVFPYVPDKQEAWDDLIKLANDKEWFVRHGAAYAFKFVFAYMPNKQNAWDNLIKLTSEKDSYVNYRVINALGSIFFHVQNQKRVWNDLIKLTTDKDKDVRAYSNCALARISIFRASQAKEEEIYKKELERAITFYQNSINEETSWSNPSEFCLPFYRSFHTIIFKKREAKVEVDRYLLEAKEAIKGSKSNEMLFKALDNLANALKEVQNLENPGFELKKDKLNSYRKYIDSTTEIIASNEDMVPYDTEVLKLGLPILERNLKEILEEIQKKAKIACKESIGTDTEEIARTINREVQNLEIGSQEEMAQKLEDICHILKVKVSDLPENDYVLNKIEAMRHERNLMRQFDILLFVIGQIPTIKVVSEQQLEQQLNPIHYKLDSISYNTNLIFNEIINIKDKLSNIKFDIFKMKLNSAEVVSNLKTIKEELEKLNKIEGFNTVSIDKLSSSQKEILNELNNNILERFNEIGILANKLPNKEDAKKILDSINKLKQSKPEILFQKFVDVISLIGFAIEVFPYLHL
jgi:HEAT repeat protein